MSTITSVVDSVNRLFRRAGADNQAFAEAVSDATGECGVRVVTGTAAQTGSWSAIQVLEDAIFSSLTDASASGDAMTGFPVPAGVVLKGRFTAFQLSSGKVRAHI